MPSKTKVQLREEAEEAKRDLRVFQEEAAAQISALRESEKTLKAEIEELRELVRELQYKLKEKTTQLEAAETQVPELQCAWKARVRDSERPMLRSTRSESPVMTEGHEVSSAVREVGYARDEALKAIDRPQWELDKLRREVRQQIDEAVQSLRQAVSNQESTVPRTGADNLGGVSPTLRVGHVSVITIPVSRTLYCLAYRAQTRHSIVGSAMPVTKSH